MNQKKILKTAGIVLAVLIVVAIVGRKQGWIGSEESTRVTAEKAEKRKIIEIVNSSGKVRPVTEAKISPDVSGEIVAIFVKEGDFVKRGDLLVRINPDIYESNLARVEAALNTSKANLANARARETQSQAQFLNAKSSFERSKTLFGQEAISESEFDSARAAYSTSEAEVEAALQSVIAAQYQVKSAEAGLREARESLSKTNIFSPMDGTISRLDAELGERVVGTSQFAGTEILRIANLNEMEVLVEVNENDIIRVSENDFTQIEIDAYPTQTFSGQVTAIANSAIQQPGMSMDQVTNFEVRIRIEHDSYAHLIDESRPHLSPFRPGMSATVDIQTQIVENALSIPIQAVTTRDEDTLTKKDKGENEEKDEEKQEKDNKTERFQIVFVEKDGIAHLRKVKSGIQDTNYIQILEGLEEGENVITGPFRAVSRSLNDGEGVQVVEQEMLFGRN